MEQLSALIRRLELDAIHYEKQVEIIKGYLDTSIAENNTPAIEFETREYNYWNGIAFGVRECLRKAKTFR